MAQDQPAPYNYDRNRRFWGLFTVFVIYGALGYYIQALNLARPKIAAAFDSLSLFSWSVSIPALVGAFVTLIFGKLSDMYGRRIILLLSVIFALVGTALCPLSPDFYIMIGAMSLASLGMGALMPLVFSVVGDMYSPVKRSKWIGLLNIPMAIAAVAGPKLGGYLPDAPGWGWPYVFWIAVPFLLLSLILVPVGIPPLVSRGIKHIIDFQGCVWAILASSTAIIGLSLAENPYPWLSKEIIGLLGISIICWIFFFRTEYRAEEPILDPEVLTNRSFFTIVTATFLFSFSQIAMMVYFPMFLQGVMDISGSESGNIFVPFQLIMALFGVPVGFLIGWTKRYKWLYIFGFSILTLQMFGNCFLKADSPVVWCWLVSIVGGIGLGAIPTVNTMAVQNAVPKRLLGAAMGALFFSLMLGIAISPAILGSAQTATYKKSLSLPEGLETLADSATLASLQNPDALLNENSMTKLEDSITKIGPEGKALFDKTVGAVRNALEASLRRVFLIGAIAILLAFLLIITVPEVPIGSGADPE